MAAVLFALVALAACEQRAPAPPRPTVQSATTNVALVGDPASGARLWRDKQCQSCHGANAAGGIGKALVQTPLPFPEFLNKIRNALPPKPAMSQSDLAEADAFSIYLWLQSQKSVSAAPTAAPASLPAGQVLGIALWTQKGCHECHGAFAQGSAEGPALAGESYPFERQRAVMRRYAEQNPAHGEANVDDEVLWRLLDWLRRGADPVSGC
jgi:mono/diheme cytochrome c family protein